MDEQKKPNCGEPQMKDEPKASKPPRRVFPSLKRGCPRR